MGACSSRRGPRSFSVTVVDDKEVVTGQGTLIVTPDMLALQQTNKSPLQWELAHVRRFGYDERFFSFEATKKCTAGKGIWTFQTKQSKTIYDTLVMFTNSHMVEANLSQSRPRPLSTTKRVDKVQYEKIGLTPSNSTGHFTPNGSSGDHNSGCDSLGEASSETSGSLANVVATEEAAGDAAGANGEKKTGYTKLHDSSGPCFVFDPKNPGQLPTFADAPKPQQQQQQQQPKPVLLESNQDHFIVDARGEPLPQQAALPVPVPEDTCSNPEPVQPESPAVKMAVV